MNIINTAIWSEKPEQDNPFTTSSARCHGYDVYGDLMENASWADMIFLLFTGETIKDNYNKAELFRSLAVVLANPGPRDPMVNAAMCGGVSGSTPSAVLMAAIAVGAGQTGGAHEVYHAMQDFDKVWETTDLDGGVNTWKNRVRNRPELDSIWAELDAIPGFDVNGTSTSKPVLQFLEKHAYSGSRPHLNFLAHNINALQHEAGKPVSMIGVAACALLDLGFTPEAGEMLHLILRLPGCAAHALEQAKLGFKNFPFPQIDLLDDPKKV